MDMRTEAENRVRQKSAEKVKLQNDIQKFRARVKSTAIPKTDIDATAVKQEENQTLSAAKLAALDYKLNGFRARASSDDFVMPRWVPNDEKSCCQKCNIAFDIMERKHHCRHCGLLVCHKCSDYRLLLPHHFGFRDPQRVCLDCNQLLLPTQHNLSMNIANHQRINNIDVVTTSDCSVRRYTNLPYSSTLGSEIRKAAYSTHNLFTLKVLMDKAVPLNLLRNAKGIAYLTVLKAGFLFAPRFGTGLVIARLPTKNKEQPKPDSAPSTPDIKSNHNRYNCTPSSYIDSIHSSGASSSSVVNSNNSNNNSNSNNKHFNNAYNYENDSPQWSAPAAIATVGLSFGLMAGLDVTDYVIILNTDEAVRAFSGYGQVTIGVGLEIAAGPVGRSASVDYHVSSEGSMAPAYSYSHSRGLFAGASLDGTVILARSDVNHKFYGKPVTPKDILSGAVPPPRAANALYQSLGEALSNVPVVSYVAKPIITPPPKVIPTIVSKNITTEEHKELQRLERLRQLQYNQQMQEAETEEQVEQLSREQHRDQPRSRQQQVVVARSSGSTGSHSSPERDEMLRSPLSHYDILLEGSGDLLNHQYQNIATTSNNNSPVNINNVSNVNGAEDRFGERFGGRFVVEEEDSFVNATPLHHPGRSGPNCSISNGYSNSNSYSHNNSNGNSNSNGAAYNSVQEQASSSFAIEDLGAARCYNTPNSSTGAAVGADNSKVRVSPSDYRSYHNNSNNIINGNSSNNSACVSPIRKNEVSYEVDYEFEPTSGDRGVQKQVFKMAEQLELQEIYQQFNLPESEYNTEDFQGVNISL